MFVVTADQRASRVNADAVPAALAAVNRRDAGELALAPERTAGDELQVAIADPAAALSIVLELTRTEGWSVGLGVGAIELPLPDSVRAARGPAFVHARDAVERAKRAPTRFALTGDGSEDAEALVRLLIEVRDRRTPEGWEVYDLLAGGVTQREAAARLGISEGAVSLRAKAAALRAEEAAVPALERILARLDAEAGSSPERPV
ncbi:DNA-binding protein [Microbacterium sp. M3]|uniref:DNA-binding protein n=1 Tax=Microbacterium arthrosphaerae TaxID=792652 RepID=A0ABU4H324_9MICO|nr:MULTISPECIES: DNA-binding protein [Microbacterium]MDW4573059.1 DNA-binding protein [Microbacterium arthrosphaerae]MDW7606914.1 DNA-binding protein [Microbacterium sp. M3]